MTRFIINARKLLVKKSKQKFNQKYKKKVIKVEEEEEKVRVDQVIK